MRVGEVCNREVVVAGRGESVLEAARLMRRHHVGDVVVSEERDGRRVPVGILTDRDIAVEVVAKEVGPETLSVADAMGPALLTAGEEEELPDLLKRMRSQGVRRVPVVDARGALVGILALDDVLELLAEELADLTALIARGQSRERRVRRD